MFSLPVLSRVLKFVSPVMFAIISVCCNREKAMPYYPNGPSQSPLPQSGKGCQDSLVVLLLTASCYKSIWATRLTKGFIKDKICQILR